MEQVNQDANKGRDAEMADNYRVLRETWQAKIVTDRRCIFCNGTGVTFSEDAKEVRIVVCRCAHIVSGYGPAPEREPVAAPLPEPPCKP